MPGRNRAPILLFRTPAGGGAAEIHGDVLETGGRLAGIISPEILAETEWIVVPDSTLLRAEWPS